MIRPEKNYMSPFTCPMPMTSCIFQCFCYIFRSQRRFSVDFFTFEATFWTFALTFTSATICLEVVCRIWCNTQYSTFFFLGNHLWPSRTFSPAVVLTYFHVIIENFSTMLQFDCNFSAWYKPTALINTLRFFLSRTPSAICHDQFR